MYTSHTKMGWLAGPGWTGLGWLAVGWLGVYVIYKGIKE